MEGDFLISECLGSEKSSIHWCFLFLVWVLSSLDSWSWSFCRWEHYIENLSDWLQALRLVIYGYFLIAESVLLICIHISAYPVMFFSHITFNLWMKYSVTFSLLMNILFLTSSLEQEPKSITWWLCTILSEKIKCVIKCIINTEEILSFGAQD